MPNFPLDLPACRDRQSRLLREMERLDLDLVITSRTEHVQWLTGPRFAWTLSAAAAIDRSGRVSLVAPQKAPESAAADEVTTFVAKWHSTLRNDQGREAGTELRRLLDQRPRPRRVGVEFSHPNLHVFAPGEVEFVDVEPIWFRLRRRKDADELALIRQAIAGTERMYSVAREIIGPGVSELEVFNRLQAAAVDEFGEPIVPQTGNDYQCASRGGAPRAGRTAQAGELYILDLGPAFRGYFADNARTIAVTKPDDRQLAAWSQIQLVFAHVERTVRPGKNARELFHEVDALLKQSPVGVFNHHLGHGIGLFPHEAPHLNPHWDDVFEVGDVFTAEPGLYAPELRAGMRIENDYRVTETGVELLTPFPLQL